MLVKVLCPCGTKFAFEVEPVNGRMPAPVLCPACSADATSLANAVVAGQLATSSAPLAAASPSADPPRVRLRASAPKAAEPPQTGQPVPAPPPESVQPRVRLATTHDANAPVAPGPEARPEFCPHHPAEPAVEHCRVCGKPICPKCMELHGYVCSVFCRSKAEREKLPLPRYARQRSVVAQAARSKARAIMMAVAAVLALLFAAWIWWTFYGTKPRVIYSLQIPKADRGGIYEMLSPTEILALKERELVLLDLAREKQLWATPLEAAKAAPAYAPLPANTPAPKKSAGPTAESTAGKLAADVANATAGQPGVEEEEEAEDRGFFSFGTPRLLTANGDLWLKFPDRVAAYDRQTGARKQEIPLKQPLLSLTHNESAIVAVSGDPRLVRTVTLITLPAGTVKTEQVAPPSDPAASVRTAGGTRPAFPLADGQAAQESATAGPRDDFIAAGPNVVQFQTKLLERRLETRPAMKPKSDKSMLESGRLSAGQSLDAAVELLNDMRRQDTGGVIQEDMSRYQVTLRRMLGEEAPAWTGEVSGPPGFFPLKTVDVLFGTKELVVFDKANKKRWEAKLTYAVTRGFSLGLQEGKDAPCVESPDALYVFDQGMLTCFELGSGQARWRLTSVGVSRVQFDQQGRLYVNTTTASPDLIDFPQQVNPNERSQPVILKVDPATGKVLWKVAQLADDCILSGRYVYAAYLSGGLGGGGTYFNLYRLDPANGKQLWHYYQERWPRNMGYQGTSFLLQWKDEVQVLKFLTL